MTPTPHTQSSIARAADVISDTPLADLAPVLTPIMDKVIAHRAANNGFVPLSVFPLVLGIAGQYTCLEYVVRVKDEDGTPTGFLLKQRGSQEQGWENQFHIPGVAITVKPHQDMMRFAEQRLEREVDIFSSDEWAAKRTTLKSAGIEVHDEPERNATCLTIVKLMDIDEDRSRSLPAGWRFVSLSEFENDTTIVDHHRRTLAWINRPDRGEFEMVDLREI